jgi:hypothetical protein
MLRTPVSCVFLLVLAVLTLAAPAMTSADDPSAATAETAGVTDITASTATFQATVTPHGLPTVAHFEYGTTVETLQSTQDVAVSAGTTDIPLALPVTGLAATQHYYVVVHATNSAGGEYGSVVEFTTPAAPSQPPPRRPVPVRPRMMVSAGSVTQFAAALHVKITGYSVPLTVTASTVGPDGVAVPSGPVTLAGDGDATLPVSGLRPHTRYVSTATATATSAGGTSTSTARFITPRLSGLGRPVVSPKSVVYGDEVTVTGVIAGASGLGVALSQQPFPFAVPFAPVSNAAGATDARGAYRFTTRALRRTRYGISAVGYVPPGPGTTAQVWVAAKVGATVKRARRHRFVVAGRYWPDVPSKATLYRLGHGRSGTVITPVSAGGNSRTFRFAVRKPKPGSYEVRLVMAAGTGIESTHSEMIKIPRR